MFRSILVITWIIVGLTVGIISQGTEPQRSIRIVDLPADIAAVKQKEFEANYRDILLQGNREAQLTALHEIIANGRNADALAPAIIETANVLDATLREESARALGALRVNYVNDSVEVCLRKLLNDPVSGVRVQALTSLGNREVIATATADVVLSLLKDTFSDVQYAAMLFLERCPTIRQKAIPEIVDALRSDRQRTRQISLDSYDNVPLAREAVRFIALDFRNGDEEMERILSLRIATSTDVRLKLACALILDPLAMKDGPVMQIVVDVLRLGELSEQIALCESIAESRLRDDVWFRLLLECSKSPKGVGTRAGLILIERNAYWGSIHDLLEDALEQEEIPSWIRGAFSSWLDTEKEE